MSSMRRIRNFISHTHVTRDWKYWQPFYPTTPTEKLMPALAPEVRVKFKPIKSNTKWLKGAEGRLQILSFRMTELVMYERIELLRHQAEELRPYAERVSANCSPIC